ncbi:MAG: hypothetical protein WCX77_00735 [Candidatus Paceibacterota bacterium]|jgi:hypothetical protein
MNKLITMNKKTKIIVATIFAIILLAVIFLEIKKYDNNNNVGFVDPQKFTEKDINGQKIYENKETGTSINLMDGWSKEYILENLVFLSPDISFKNVALKPETGCTVSMSIKRELIFGEKSSDFLIIKYATENYDKLDEDIKSEYQPIDFHGIKAVQYSQEIGSNLVRIVGIKFVKNNRLYDIRAWLSGQDKDRCEKEDFGKFLETVSIK